MVFWGFGWFFGGFCRFISVVLGIFKSFQNVILERCLVCDVGMGFWGVIVVVVWYFWWVAVCSWWSDGSYGRFSIISLMPHFPPIFHSHHPSSHSPSPVLGGSGLAFQVGHAAGGGVGDRAEEQLVQARPLDHLLCPCWL